MAVQGGPLCQYGLGPLNGPALHLLLRRPGL